MSREQVRPQINIPNLLWQASNEWTKIDAKYGFADLIEKSFPIRIRNVRSKASPYLLGIFQMRWLGLDRSKPLFYFRERFKEVRSKNRSRHLVL